MSIHPDQTRAILGNTTSDQLTLLRLALTEDIGDGDHTSLATVGADLIGIGTVKAKSAGVVAGITVGMAVARLVDSAILVTPMVSDGTVVTAGTELMTLKGPVRSLLSTERLLLNCMQRMSGIATMTKNFVDRIQGTNCRILDTRKTTPNFRVFEKMAVKIGGGHNHRHGLYDMILIKDNHVDAAGGIRPAITNTTDYLRSTGKSLAVEIETRNLQEVEDVLSIGQVNRIMLDNFSLSDLKAAVGRIAGRFETEASGGITIETVRAVAETGVDFISVGALTHSYQSMDISMKIKPV